MFIVGTESPVFATLKVGGNAPDFTAPATLGGKEFTFDLKDALRKGPVVVYFYPAAYTKGCTIEAHDLLLRSPNAKIPVQVSLESVMTISPP